MAEEMANAEASKKGKRTGRSTAENSKSARKGKANKAPEPVPVAPETKENPQANKAPDSSETECQSAELNLDLHSRMKEAIAKRFPEIITGLMVGISQGKPGGAKVLFDALEQLKSDPGTAQRSPEEGLRILDVVDPDFDWRGLVNAEKHADPETPDAEIDGGIDVGPNVDIAGREPK